MDTADFNHNHFSSGNREGDNNLLVKFFNKAMRSEDKSREEGRPIFDEVEYVDIRVAGSKNGHICRPARLDDKSRFPDHYNAFKNRMEMPVEGTPLTEWAVITRSQAEELAFFNVKTVEQLASMSDGQSGKFMGMNSLRQKAKDWVKEAKDNAPSIKMAEELRERDDTITALTDKLAALTDMVDKLTAPEDPKAAPSRRKSKG